MDINKWKTGILAFLVDVGETAELRLVEEFVHAEEDPGQQRELVALNIAVQQLEADGLVVRAQNKVGITKAGRHVRAMMVDAQVRQDDPFYYWTVRIGVHPRWVADGFNLSDERMENILRSSSYGLDFAYEGEVTAVVQDWPVAAAIKAEQSGAPQEENLGGSQRRVHKPRMCSCGEMLTGTGCGCEPEQEE